jgi:hypothetical protein
MDEVQFNVSINMFGAISLMCSFYRNFAVTFSFLPGTLLSGYHKLNPLC